MKFLAFYSFKLVFLPWKFFSKENEENPNMKDVPIVCQMCGKTKNKMVRSFDTRRKGNFSNGSNRNRVCIQSKFIT